MSDAPLTLLTQLLRTLGSVEARLEASLEPLDLSVAKLRTLWHLAEAGDPLPLGTLAERCECARSNITQLVDRLEAEGLVVRTYDLRDRRCVLASLTGKGRTRYAAGRKAVEAAELDIFAPLAKQQRTALLATLEVLAGDR